jgi:pimeloyl-ACP methyl ester carboxylesterase
MRHATLTQKALRASILLASVALPLSVLPPDVAFAEEPGSATASAAVQIHYKTATIGGVKIAYREAGRADAPAIVLLHGFPTSSHQYRNLIPALADKYRVIAPDYPGFGQSAAPERSQFKYTFDSFAKIVEGLIEKVGISYYALYVMDYGAPVGFRIAAKHPERVTALIVQNGNAYTEGLQNCPTSTPVRLN